MPSRSPSASRPAWRNRRWCTACRGYYHGASCGCAWSWGSPAASPPAGSAQDWAAPASWSQGPAPGWVATAQDRTWTAWSQDGTLSTATTAAWSGAQNRARSTSSGRRRERSLSRQRKPSEASLWGTWEQRELLTKLRAAEKACVAAGDSEGAIAVSAQCDTVTESMYEALPMHARIAHWEGRLAAQHEMVARLTELAALQLLKLNKTKSALNTAEGDLTTQERKLRELAEEQASWGPGTNLSVPEPNGGPDTWDGYVWDYHTMDWKWLQAAPPNAVTDPYLQEDMELKDNILLLLRQVHDHAPTSSAYALAQGIQLQSARHAARGAGVKSETGSAAPSPTASQASTVGYSPAQHPFRMPVAAAPAAAAAPSAAPSLQARAKALPRATGTLNAAMRRLVPAKRGGRTARTGRVGVASPARSVPGAVDIHKLRFGASELVIIDDGDMEADGEGYVGDLVNGPTAARPAAFPQAAGEAAAALA